MLDTVPIEINKGGSKWKLFGVILFRNRHYTSFFYDSKFNRWIYYDNTKKHQSLSEENMIKFTKQMGRSLFYVKTN